MDKSIIINNRHLFKKESLSTNEFNGIKKSTQSDLMATRIN